MDDLLNVLPDATDLRTAARILREEGQYEIAMRIEDSARIVRRYEMSDRYAVTSAGRDALRDMDLESLDRAQEGV